MKMRTSIDFPTLPYNHVTNSFLLEIWFWGPIYPTSLYDVTLFTLFYFELLQSSSSSSSPVTYIKISCQLLSQLKVDSENLHLVPLNFLIADMFGLPCTQKEGR